MKNAHGTLSRSPQEWGSKARKEEAKLRGHRRRGDRDNIEEQLDDMEGNPGVDRGPVGSRIEGNA